MLTKGTGFARYSKGLCWFVALICLVLSVFSFYCDSDNGMLNGFLWLAGAVAFAVSAMALGRNTGGSEGAASSESGE